MYALVMKLCKSFLHISIIVGTFICQEQSRKKEYKLDISTCRTIIWVVLIWSSQSLYALNSTAENEKSVHPVETTSIDIGALIKTIKVPAIDSSGMSVNVHKLLTKSSIATLVQSSDSDQVISMYRQAIQLYNQSVNQDDSNESGQLLNQARMAMLKAGQLARQSSGSTDKWQKEYNKRLASVDSLVNALSGIGDDKSTYRQTIEETLAEVNRIRTESSQLASAKQWEQANETLQHAYLMVKTAIQNMRQGDVLVRTLNFATPAEEYHYELDRNQTHFMLLKLLVERKTNLSERVSVRINTSRAQAEQLADEAEQLFQAKDFKQAISKLEESTRFLIKAIRMGGVFIPG